MLAYGLWLLLLLLFTHKVPRLFKSFASPGKGDWFSLAGSSIKSSTRPPWLRRTARQKVLATDAAVVLGIMVRGRADSHFTFLQSRMQLGC